MTSGTRQQAAGAEPDTELAARLRICLAKLARLSRATPGAAGLTPSQVAVLAAVEASPHMRIGDIATEQNIRPPSATRIVQVLVDGGYLERHDDPRDMRVTLISITPAGQSAIATIRNQTTDAITQRLTTLPHDEKDQIRRAISALEHLAASTSASE